MLQNQNYEPDSTSHFPSTLSESDMGMAQKCKNTHTLGFFNTSKKIVSSAPQTVVTLWLNQEVGRLSAQVILFVNDDFPYHCIRRCALSLLEQAHSVVNANEGYLVD